MLATPPRDECAGLPVEPEAHRTQSRRRTVGDRRARAVALWQLPTQLTGGIAAGTACCCEEPRGNPSAHGRHQTRRGRQLRPATLWNSEGTTEPCAHSCSVISHAWHAWPFPLPTHCTHADSKYR